MSTIALRPAHPDGPTVPTVVAIGCVSALLVVIVLVLQWLALLAAGVVAVGALVCWRPRYGLYLTLLCLTAFDAFQLDVMGKVGWYLQSDISSTTPIRFLVLSPLEALLGLTALSAVVHAAAGRRALRPMKLVGPLAIFGVLMVFSIAWGMRGGAGPCVNAVGRPAGPTAYGSSGWVVSCGDNAPKAPLAAGTPMPVTPASPGLNTALWETRTLFAAILVALLIPQVLERTDQVDRLLNMFCIGAVALSIDVIVRRFTLLAAVPTGHLDLDFDHVTPAIMNFAVILLLARLIWPATVRQRLMAVFIPLILYAEMVTERRAGWVGLDLGIVLLGIFIFRLRQKVFFLIVLPLLFVYAGYLITFWNADGAVAQPARAVRSIISPDPRDAASNGYRVIEEQDIRINLAGSPLTGLGFGQPYVFYIPLPDLGWWPFWHYEAHNSVFWLWMVMGPAGFIAFLSVSGATIALGVQLLKREANGRMAPILVALAGLILMMLVYSFVDLGLFNLRLMAWTGAAIGIIGAHALTLARADAEHQSDVPAEVTA